MTHGSHSTYAPFAFPAAVAVALFLFLATAASGLIMVGKGNDPVHDNNWPAGSPDVANLKTRVAWWEGPPFGGGQHNFLYRGDAAAFQAALDLFAKIKAPKLEVVVHEGPGESFVLKDQKDPKADAHVDWSFTVWNPDNWNRLYNDPKNTWNAEDPNFRKPLAAPRMDVYVGGPDGKGIDWAKVKLPDNVTVTDERASANGFKDGSAVVGDVYDLLTSKPIPGAQIALTTNKGQNEKHEYVYETAASAKADDAGHFEIRQVPAGSYRVVASSGGAAPRVLGYAQFGKDTYKKYDVRLAGAATIAGTVTDPAGKPVAGATVRADSIMGPDGHGYDMPDRPQATTDAQGKFTIDTLPRGHCQLFPHLTGYHAMNLFKVYDVPATDPVGLKMQTAGNLKAKVTTIDGTPPHAQFMIEITPEGGNKVGSYGGGGDVDKKAGTIEFKDVPPGKYVISARANPGRSDVKGPDKTVEIKGGETTEVEFTVPEPK